jgi:hypothetical protein
MKLQFTPRPLEAMDADLKKNRGRNPPAAQRGDCLMSDSSILWPTKRLKYLAYVQKGRLPGETSQAPVSDTDVPYLSMEYLRGETNMASRLS